MSVFPKSYLSERVKKTLQGNGRAYRSACGRSVPDEGKIEVYGWTEENVQGRSDWKSLKSRVAEIHKPLMSANSMSEKQSGWIGKRNGVNSGIMPNDSPLAKKVDALIAKEKHKPENKFMPLESEGGTYGFWLWTEEKDVNSISVEKEAKSMTKRELAAALAKATTDPTGPTER